MPQCMVGQPVRVRVGHEGCTWCEAAQGRRGAVQAITRLDNELMYDLRFAVTESEGGTIVALKEDCTVRG